VAGLRDWLHHRLLRAPRLYELIETTRRRRNYDKTVFLRTVADGDVVFDVGASIGHYTSLFSHMVGRNGEVHAFEPVPWSFERLRRRIRETRRFDNVVLNNVAVGEGERRRVGVLIPGDDHGQASLLPHQEGSWQFGAVRTVESELLSLDDYASSRSVRRLDFVKMDVEGAELPALRGGRATISAFRPLLYLETHHAWTEAFGYEPADLLDFLADLGYSALYKVDKRAIASISDPRAELSSEQLTHSVNLLCGVPALHAKRLARRR
jgi:FkbM family methyltransferase